MPEIPIVIALWVLTMLYVLALAEYSGKPDAPLPIRWIDRTWHLIAHSWRRPAPLPRRPDYRKIERLERELGIAEPGSEPATGSGIRRSRTVCLVKNCCGDTEEIRTWSGMLVMRVHRCQPEPGLGGLSAEEAAANATRNLRAAGVSFREIAERSEH